MKKLVCALLLLGCAFLVSCRSRTTEPPKTTESTTEYVIDADSLLDAEEVVHHDCSVHGHVFSKATCQKVATCFYCGEMTGELAPHDWMHATCIAKATCTVCGATTGSYAAHRFTKATCAGPASCSVCGATTGSALAHHFRAATCVSPSMCTGCMKKQGSALGHVWSGGSCTQGQTCSRCKRQLPAPGHKMTGGSCTTDAVCSVCGYTEKAKGHQYVDGVCTVCGKTTFQAQQDDATRTTTAESTEVETTLPEIDVDQLNAFAGSIRTLLQTAHDSADASISASAEEGRALALSATDSLREAQALIEEAAAYCKTDARLKPAGDSLSAVGKAIQSSAAVKSFYDSTFIKTVTTIRADSTKALNALAAYEKEIKKFS